MKALVRGRVGYSKASINRSLEALKRSYTLGMENTPPLVTRMPKIPMLDESDNVREGFLEHPQYVAMRDQLPKQLRLVLACAAERFSAFAGIRWTGQRTSSGLRRHRLRPSRPALRRCMGNSMRGSRWHSLRGKAQKEVKSASNKARERAPFPAF